MIVRLLRDISIRNKFIVLVMAISFAALGVTFGIFTLVEVQSERERALEELSTLADFVGFNVRASLVFADEEFAKESLDALSVRKDITAAYLLRSDKSLFSWYRPDGSERPLQRPEAEQRFSHLLNSLDEKFQSKGHVFSQNALSLMTPVVLDGEEVGYLVLQSRLTKVKKTISGGVNTSLASFALSLLLAYLLSNRLQGLFTRPIDELTKAMDRVSGTENYGLRLDEERHDELGSLIAGFNHMLEQIGVRDRQLEEANRSLEERVKARTFELSRANAELRSEVEERQRAEKALQESEAKFRLLFENSPICLWEADCSLVNEHLSRLQEGGVEDFSAHFANHPEEIYTCTEKIRVIDLNRKTLEKFKAASKEQLLANLPQIFSEKSHGALSELMAALGSGETYFEVEGVSRTLDGDERLFSIRFSLVPDEARNMAVVSLIDITGSKKAELALRESEERFRTLVEQATDGFLVHDLEGNLLDVNKRMCSMMGYSREELLGMSVRDLDETYDADLYESLWSGLRPGDSFTVEGRGHRRDGRAIEVEANLGVVESAGERRILALIRDVSRRKATERELLSAKARLEHLLTSTPAGIYTAKATGDGVTFVSENVAMMLGYTPSQFIEASEFWADRIHPDDRERILAQVPAGIDKGAHRHEYRFRHGDGSYRWMLDEFKLIRDDEERPLEIVGYWIDITQRKEVEKRLRLSLHEKEVLLQEVHHRVKNNLQIISSLLNLQLRKVRKQETIAELSVARNRIHSMALLHDSLYRSEDLSRLNFAEYIKELSMRLADLFDGASGKIDLIFDLEEAWLDVGRAIPCSMVINELITNAYKHAFPGDRPGKITVGLKTQGGCHTLYVRDDGVGIHPEAAGEKTDSLGLQLVYSLAKQLGGKVTVEGGEGTRVAICFHDLAPETGQG